MNPADKQQTITQDKTAINSLPFYKRPLYKTLFYSFIWAFVFAAFLPLGTINPINYSFFLGSVPNTLLWDTFNIQNQVANFIVSLLNASIMMMPYFYYRKTQLQHWWLYLSFSLYGFINAALGFTIIISLKGLSGH